MADDTGIGTMLIGLDAGCQSVLDRLDNGTVPTLRSLLDTGVSGTLRSQIPPWTPSAWPSLYTGMNPGQHGIFDFLAFEGYEWDVVNATHCRERPIWELLDRHGYRSVVVNVPVTHPPAAFDGALVPGYMAPESPTCHPDGIFQELEEEIGNYHVYPADTEDASGYTNAVASRGAAFRYLADRFDPDFGFLQFQQTDTVFHERPDDWQTIAEIYRAVDAEIDRVLEEYQPDNVFVVSDHGIGKGDTVDLIIADQGCGMERDTIRDVVFQTGNREQSEGILNNMGAGLKASIAWCEHSLKQTPGVSSLQNPFHLLSKTEDADTIQRVDGPIAPDMEIMDSDDRKLWQEGAGELDTDDHGTRVHLTAGRKEFDDDISPKSKRMSMKMSYLALVLGIRFRRLLAAHDETSITITYRDEDADGSTEEGSIDVPPVEPVYEDKPSLDIGDAADYDSFPDFQEALDEADIDDGLDYNWTAKTFEDDRGVTYNISYECGFIDLGATAEAVDADENNFIVTTPSSDNFRWRYNDSEHHAGIDIYGNGRVLDVSKWPFSVKRHGRFTRFVGELQIEPAEPTQHEVPTENDKTGIDKTSSLWRQIEDWLGQDENKPFSHEYASQSSSGSGSSGSGSGSSGSGTSGSGGSGSGSGSSGSGGSGSGGSGGSGSGGSGGSGSGGSGSGGSGLGSSGWVSQSAPDAVFDSMQSNLDENHGIDTNLDADGATIDIVHTRPDGSKDLYRVISEEAVPDDIYALVMYQDHFKRRSDSDGYDRTILLSDGISDEAADDLEKLNGRTDEHGDSCQFEHHSTEGSEESMPWMSTATE
jgi:hypothetical protein